MSDIKIPQDVAPRTRFFENEHSGTISRFLRSDWFRNVTTFFAALVAVVSITATNYFQQRALKSQIDFQAEKAANDAWIVYREFEDKFLTATKNPYDYSKMSAPEQKMAFITVERLLMAADIVTYSLGDDKQWEGAFAIEFHRHKNFLLSDAFLKEEGGRISELCTYRHAVHEWVERAMIGDNEAHQKIIAAHKICERHLDSQDYSDKLGQPK